MNIIIQSEDGFSDVVFSVTSETRVEDILTDITTTWDTESNMFCLTFCGNILHLNEPVVSCGIENESQLVAVRNHKKICTKSDLLDENKKKDVERYFNLLPTETLILDASTFLENSNSSQLDLTTELLPKNVKHISFMNGLQVDSIGSFLVNSDIVSADLSALVNVTVIRFQFIQGSHSLESLNMKSMSRLHYIEDSFLCGCRVLRSLNFPNSQNLLRIGNFFLYQCVSIESVRLINLGSVKSIGFNFLRDCKSLKNVDIPSPCPVTRIE